MQKTYQAKEKMETKDCECGGIAKEVIKPEGWIRVGWYCGECRAFDKAIGREKKVA
jgi:hypothetical protein